MDALDAALYRALHGKNGAGERWARLRGSLDVDDEAIEKWIAYEFGPSGGFSDPGGPWVRFCGGKSPRFWFDTPDMRSVPTLEGPALVAAARSVLNIPRPSAEPEQMGLFP